VEQLELPMASRHESDGRPPLERCSACGADLPQDDEPRRVGLSPDGVSANGRGTVATAPSDSLDDAPSDITLEHALTAGERDQTASDSDQTASDSDQTASDRDQTASDQDEDSSRDDQEESDRELEEGSDPAAHELHRLARSRTSAERLITSQARDDTAQDRSQIANERDQIANERDQIADERDQVAESRDRLAGGAAEAVVLPGQTGYGSIRRQDNRTRAANDRATAAQDRELAAQDRREAASLRVAAARDRAAAVQERNLAGIDQLTGVSLRSIGLGQVEREIQRSRRTGRPLVLAFVDINNLKAVNDNQGHLAGDVVLHRVAETLRVKLRPYDVIVRFGGDEFVCALANIDAEAARERFEDIISTLEESGLARPISFGLAELRRDDDLERLLGRADEALIETRRSSGHRSGRS
jgi:diguanylate cyclase (GGDEF)-like protein